MIKLFRNQEIALSYMRTNNFFALFMEQGCGKTLPTLVRILDLLKSGKIESALVVAPKSALGAWERDIELFNEFDKEILQDAITLINYDIVWRGEDKSPYFKPYECIVLDEAHNIKNRTSRRSKFLLKIATMSDYRYILTGTPIGNGKLEDIEGRISYVIFLDSDNKKDFKINVKVLLQHNTYSETLEESKGTFEIRNNKYIYVRDEIIKEDKRIKIPTVSSFKIENKKLILENNYLSKYTDKVILIGLK